MRSVQPYSQRDVAEWFDATYRRLGFDYLRPLDAYPIYLQLLGARAGDRLLDVACGPGRLLRAAELRELRPCGVDLSAAALGVAVRYAETARVARANAESLPFADRSFDHVTCIGALERFFDRRKALAEMRRVARDDARLCLMVRNASAPGWRLWYRLLRRQNHRGHQDAGTLEQWSALLADSGWEVEAVHIDQWPRQRLRRVLRGFRRRDPRRDEPIARPLVSLRLAGEFIFVLRKAGR